MVGCRVDAVFTSTSQLPPMSNHSLRYTITPGGTRARLGRHSNTNLISLPPSLVALEAFENFKPDVEVVDGEFPKPLLYH